MTWRIILTVVEIGLLVLVLAIYLATITFGVRAVETMCAVIGPAVDKINGNLSSTANGLTQAAISAEQLAR